MNIDAFISETTLKLAYQKLDIAREEQAGILKSANTFFDVIRFRLDVPVGVLNICVSSTDIDNAVMRLAQPRTYKDERGQPLLSMDGPIQLNEELFANPKLYATILKGGFSDPTEKVMRKYYIPSWEEGEVREEVKKQDIRDGIALIESSHKAAKSLNLTGERYFDFMVEVAATSAVYNAATDMSRTPLRPGARVMQNNNQPKTS